MIDGEYVPGAGRFIRYGHEETAHDRICPFETGDPFDNVVAEILHINRRKRGDYATSQDPWSNFKDSGRQVNGPAGTAVEVLIATKQSRLRQLLGTGREPQNEGTRDSLLDRAVYSVIALAMYDEGLYQDGGTEEAGTQG